MYQVIRPLLFALDAESAHRLTLAMFRQWHRFSSRWDPLSTSLRSFFRPGLATSESPVSRCGEREVMGIRFPNPVGLAAGLDKNGEYIDALATLGFGFVEIGTVTPRAQPGNPQPRMFRLPQARAVINRLGFNNHGVDRLVENVRASGYRGVLGINIGKNADTPLERAADDYLACLRKVYPLATYVTVNISSPNTQRLRELQQGDELDRLLTALKQEQRALAQTYGRHVPLAVKIAPDLEVWEIRAIADALKRHEIEAAIATNTTLARDGVEALPHAGEAGGLSGAPLTARSTSTIRELVRSLAGALPVIGAGGILSAADAAAKIAAGAKLVQLYTGLVYRGPELVGECVAALCEDRMQPPMNGNERR